MNCACGCGQPAPIAKATDRKRGYVKGEPMRFVLGHWSRTREAHEQFVSPERAEKVAASQRGRKCPESTRRLLSAKARERWRDPEERRRQSECQRRRFQRPGEVKFGPDHPCFRGGQRNERGRVLVLVGRDHPMADRSGYCRRSRLVVAGMVGRWLQPGEVVHHIDGDGSNDAPSNLQLCESQAAHMRLHWQLRQTGGRS